MTLRIYLRVYRAAGFTDESYIGFPVSLSHFTSLRSLAINATLNDKIFDLWESIGGLISTGSLNSGIRILSIRFTWRPPRKCVNSDYISSGLELVLGKTEVLDPLLEAFFDQLTTLSLDMRYAWPINLHDELYNEALTRFSQPATEGVLRKNLPRISQMVCLNVSVSHSKEL